MIDTKYKRLNWQNLELCSLKNEIWVDVFGYDGVYEVSNLGRVKSLERTILRSNGTEMYIKERILKQSYIGKSKKRLCVGFSVDNIHKKQEVNTVVFYSFNPELHSDNSFKKEVCHLDKDGLNNKLDNLSLIKISDSKKIGWELGIYNKCYEEYDRRKKVTDSILVKTCVICKKKKQKEHFERTRKKCRKCRNLEKTSKRNNSTTDNQ